MRAFVESDLCIAYGHKAIVRQPLIGSTPEGVIGVEYVTAGRGDCDGTYKGKKYFSCASRCGQFVHEARISPYDGKECASILIQSIFRGFVRRREFEQYLAFTFWNELENNDEKEALANNRDVSSPVEKNIMKQLSDECDMEVMSEDLSEDLLSPDINRRDTRRRSSARRPSGRGSIDMSIFAADPIDPEYTGPHLTWPMTRQFALELLSFYRGSKGLLPVRYALEILTNMVDHLRDTVKGAVIYVKIPKQGDARLITVGDVHGQLNDVMWLFYKFGPPSSTNIYLFNGDIADRGTHATEIFLLLFCFKLAQPDSVIINRGNHESADMNEIYGFAQEVRGKYAGAAYDLFQKNFHLLPLCVVLEERVLVVHGGLSRKDKASLKQINAIDRVRPCPATPSTYDDTLMFDILWSDPQPEPGKGISTRGSDCFTFGPDITDDFLARNRLEVCIRSHQVPSNLRGFEPVHEGRCVTLFSASNYCGTTGNFGAVIIFKSGMNFEIQEYMAPTLKDVNSLYMETAEATRKVAGSAHVREMEAAARARNRKAATSRMEVDILNKIGKLICEKKQELWWFLFNLDEQANGHVTAAVWREACEAVLGEKLPWVFLMRKMMVEPSSCGLIAYNEVLQRFKIEFRPAGFKHQNWRTDTIRKVFESILAADLSLKETLIVFDRNCDGTVSYRELYEFLSALEIGLSEPQVKILMRSITASHVAGGGAAAQIDAAEFLARFKVMYASEGEITQTNSPWIEKALRGIGRCILSDKAEAAKRHYEAQDPHPNERTSRRRSSAVRAVALFQKFKDYNGQGDGYLMYNDFITAIKQLPLYEISREIGFELTDEHLQEMAKAVDQTGSGKINYLEFLNAFYVVDHNSHSNVAEELWCQICTTLFQHKGTIRRALHKFDADMTGKVDLDDFRSALTALNVVLARTEAPLTDDQIDSLVNCCDCDENGLVEYEEFLESFWVIMTMPKKAKNETIASKDSSIPHD